MVPSITTRKSCGCIKIKKESSEFAPSRIHVFKCNKHKTKSRSKSKKTKKL